MYPAYDGDKDYDYDTAQYTFPHRKRTYNEEDNSEDYFENAVYEDSVNFSSMITKTFLYGELIIKTSSYKQIIKDLLIF